MRFIAPATLLFFFLALPAAGQNLQTDIGRAMQLLQQGNPDRAVATIDSLANRHPDAQPVWNAAGLIHRGAGNHQRALEAFERLESLNPGSGSTAFQLGLQYAFLERRDEAFAWLHRAKDTGTVLVPNVALTPAAATLRADARWASLFPDPDSYGHPFVEDRILLQDWYGEQSGDVFGWIARAIGDVDGDGVQDLVTSATGYNNQAGKVYVYSGGKGDLLWSVEGTVSGGRLGHGIEAAGDVNADGIPDVIASAPYINRVHVYSGDDGRELFSVAGADTIGAFGLSVKGIGDINFDGYGDLLIGEPFQVWGFPINGGDMSRPGQVHVISGADTSLLLLLRGETPGDGFGATVSGKTVDGNTLYVVGAPGGGSEGTGKAYVYDALDGRPLFTAEPDAGGAQYGGMFLSVVGDLDADGYQDVYISDWGDNEVAPGAGKVYLYSGRNGDRLFALTGEAAGDGYGIGIADAGDVDRDGHDDLIVGAWQHASAAPSGGKLYIHSGVDGALLYTLTGDVAGETLGFDTTGIGDVDGDGWVDFLITSAYSMRNGFRAGRTFIVSGRPE